MKETPQQKQDVEYQMTKFAQSQKAHDVLLNKMEGRLENITALLVDVVTKLRNIEDSNVDIRRSVRDINSKVSQHEQQIKDLTSTINDLRSEMITVKSSHSRCKYFKQQNLDGKQIEIKEKSKISKIFRFIFPF